MNVEASAAPGFAGAVFMGLGTRREVIGLRNPAPENAFFWSQILHPIFIWSVGFARSEEADGDENVKVHRRQVVARHPKEKKTPSIEGICRASGVSCVTYCIKKKKSS